MYYYTYQILLENFEDVLLYILNIIGAYRRRIIIHIKYYLNILKMSIIHPKKNLNSK